jgi:hypothetical protein
MTIKSLFTFLLGSRKAILDIVRSPHALWIGLLLVLSAGFAREYDGEDLLREPWHLVLPLGASLVTSFLLFSLVWGVAKMRRLRGGTFKGVYPRFLALYWMTAPLAWLYAIPVERFLSAGDATSANLWLLGLVAFWRVVLISRVVAVLFRASGAGAFSIVMLFADSLMLFLLTQTPLPVFSLMGGIRLTESEQVIQATAFFTTALGVVTWPIWLIAAAVAAFAGRRRWRLPRETRQPAMPVSRPVWLLAAASIVVWTPILFITQPEQQLRYAVERDLRSGRIETAIALMSAHERSDFPPHWDPPPRVGYGEKKPPMLDVMEMVVAARPAPWVRELFVEKYRNFIGRGYGATGLLSDLDSAQLDRHLTILEQIPEGREILEDHLHFVGIEERWSQAERERIQALRASGDEEAKK